MGINIYGVTVMCGKAPTQPLTPAQLALDALAAELAVRNPDAAEELARRMAHHAAQRKRVRGFGISIHVNLVTGRLELQVAS